MVSESASHAFLKGFSGGWDVRVAVDRWRLARFSPTSLTGGGDDQLIRECIRFWDEVGSPLNTGPYAHKRPQRGLDRIGR